MPPHADTSNEDSALIGGIVGSISAIAIVIIAAVASLLLVNFFRTKSKRQKGVEIDDNAYASPDGESTPAGNHSFPQDSEEHHIYATPTCDSPSYYCTIAEINQSDYELSEFGMQTNECYTSSMNKDDIYEPVS